MYDAKHPANLECHCCVLQTQIERCTLINCLANVTKQKQEQIQTEICMQEHFPDPVTKLNHVHTSIMVTSIVQFSSGEGKK